jgi:hypothetical protein
MEVKQMLISKNRAGMIVGVFSGVCHLGWALLVAFNFAQRLTDWIFKVHFIEPPYVLTPFDPLVALTLIVFTAVAGYVTGWVFAAIWNWVQPREISEAHGRHVPVGV